MGCNQSSQSGPVTLMPSIAEKWASRNGAKQGGIAQPPPEFLEELSKPYQDVLDGHLPNMTKSGVVADAQKLEVLLKEYKECEERIRAQEKEDPLILYYVKQSRLKSIEETIKLHTGTIETLTKRVTDELEASSNGISMKNRTLRSALVQAGDAAKLSKAEQETIARKNQLEIATTELEMLFQEKAILESDIQELKTACAKLTNDYKHQVDVARQLSLTSAGRGEINLTNELGKFETKRINVSEVHERWKEARIQVADSCRQFSSALQKWRGMKDDSVDNQFDISEEVRDELITALQFLSNTKFYIQHELPYCTKEEVSILSKALTYIFVDMRSDERRKHADNCYAAFHNRSVALYAWIDTTIKAVIHPVVTQTSDDLKGIMEELQDLRFQSVKNQFPNTTWYNSSSDESNGSKERSRSISPGENLSDKMSIQLLQQLDLSQLAPLPRTVDIFGNPDDDLDLVEKYKATLRESLVDDHDAQAFLENSFEGLVEKRRESLTEKELVEEDTVGLA